MDISKNQWRSTGGQYLTIEMTFEFLKKYMTDYGILVNFFKDLITSLFKKEMTTEF